MSLLLRVVKKVLPRPKGQTRIRLQKAFMRACRIIPVNRKKVVFSSFFGTRYDDNPRAIFLEMVKQRPDWKYIWLLPDEKETIEHAMVVTTGSFDAIYHLATAGLWIDNCRKDYWLSKRKKQYYVQTWHGNVAIKKVEKDAEAALSQEYIQSAKNDSKMANLFVSGTKWRTENYRKAFWYDGEILEVGYPYSDVLYGDKQSFHQKVCEYYGLSEKTKLCVYAPTFRQDHSLDCYDMNYNAVIEALTERFGGEWKLLLRLHPNVRDQYNSICYTEDILDASSYKEMAELAAGADFLITDYSSTMIDAMEAKVPGLIYASDFDEYNRDRSLYFDKGELPYLFCETNDQLIHEIKMFDEAACMAKAQNFYDSKGFYNDAHSTERVVACILKKLGR